MFNTNLIRGEKNNLKKKNIITSDQKLNIDQNNYKCNKTKSHKIYH